MRIHFIETRNKLNRHQLDSREKHNHEWKILRDFFSGNDPFLDKVSPNYSSLGIEEDSPEMFDYLSVAEFEQAVNFINFCYGEARNNKNISGQHKDFIDFVGGKLWLVVYDDLLHQIGDRDLMNASFAQLPEEVFNVSTTIKRDTVSPLSAADSSSKNKSSTFGESRVATLNSFQQQNSKMNNLFHTEETLTKRKRYYEIADHLLIVEQKLFKARIFLKTQQGIASKEELTFQKSYKKRMKLHLKHLTKGQMDLENELGITENDVSDSDSSVDKSVDNFQINSNAKVDSDDNDDDDPKNNDDDDPKNNTVEL